MVFAGDGEGQTLNKGISLQREPPGYHMTLGHVVERHGNHRNGEALALFLVLLDKITSLQS